MRVRDRSVAAVDNASSAGEGDIADEDDDGDDGDEDAADGASVISSSFCSLLARDDEREETHDPLRDQV